MNKGTLIFLLLFVALPAAFAIKGVVIGVEDGAIIEASFLDLNDTPTNYTGQGDLCLVVNGAETGVVFGSCSNASGSGDITAVLTPGGYLSGGQTSGSVSLLFNETLLNQTIDSRSSSGGFDGNASSICGDGEFLNGDGTCDAGFLDADGSDADTTYIAGVGLNLTGTTFHLNTTFTDLLYAPIIWGYNQTTPANTYTDTRVGQNDLHLHSLLNITGTDHNTCSAGNFVQNVTFQNGNLIITCDAPSGSGDITNVQGDGTYVYNGSTSGDVFLAFNETKLNQTIDSRDSDTTYTNGSGTSLVGTQFNHSDTSSVADFDNNGNIFVQDISFDEFGHVLSGFGAAVNFNTPLSHAVFAAVNSSNWGNVTITESQISDLTHTVDTNETSRFANLVDADCSGTDKVVGVQSNGTVLCGSDQTGGGGGGNPFDQTLNTTSNVTFHDIHLSGSLNVTENVTVHDRLCLNAACTSYLYNNGTDSIWV